MFLTVIFLCDAYFINTQALGLTKSLRGLGSVLAALMLRSRVYSRHVYLSLSFCVVLSC
jgi:hypothetical protein